MEQLQRIDSWYEERKGKFTASEIYKLMGVKGLGETGKTYAIEKAIEELYGIQEEAFVSYDMQRGIELEPLAFAKVQELKSLEFLEVETCGFVNLNENAGASPDGLIGGKINLEIKCPKNETFFKLVASNEIDKKYLYQMQMQMMVTDTLETCFFNYCVIDGTEYWHEIKVEKDPIICELIYARIAEAENEKQNFINKLKENQQWK